MGIGPSYAGPVKVSCTGKVKSPSKVEIKKALLAVARRVAAQLSKHSLGLEQGEGDGDLESFSIFESVEPGLAEELMRLAWLDLRAQRAIGAMQGLAVADAVGAMFEFLPVGQEGSSFDPKTLGIVGEYNKFSLKLGQWTDDTSMALCLADSLLACNGYDGSDIRVRFWNWWHRGYNNAFRHDESRSGSVGVGGNVSMSLLVMGSSSSTSPPPPRYEGFGEDAGNGSLMRLAPVPIFFHGNEETAIRLSAESSYTTHPGSCAADACAFLGFLVARAIVRRPRWGETCASFLDSHVELYMSRPDVQEQKDLLRLLRSAEPPGSPERCWNWRDPAGPFVLEAIAARGSTYNGYPVRAGYFGSYSMDGLAVALFCLYHTRSFMAAISRCVNLLGDADSTGAICGQLAGAFYGAGAIDPRLVSQIRRWDNGEIALRGALLFVLGRQMFEDVLQRQSTAETAATTADTLRSDCTADMAATDMVEVPVAPEPWPQPSPVALPEEPLVLEAEQPPKSGAVILVSPPHEAPEPEPPPCTEPQTPKLGFPQEPQKPRPKQPRRSGAPLLPAGRRQRL